MNLSVLRLAAVLCTAGFVSSAAFAAAASSTAGMQEGALAPKSLARLAFGPDGVLFAADTRAATLYAIATGDTARGDATKRLAVEGIDAKVAALLGTTASEILINDIAVNPISRQAYLAVSRGLSVDAVPVLVRVKLDGTLEQVSLDRIRHSKVELANAPAEPAPAATPAAGGRGNRNPRLESITDIGYADGKVIIAGLSNEEFASTLRMVNFPFAPNVGTTGVEIYHGNHGRFETASPIRTFTTVTTGNQSRLLAAYQCTPLVDLAMSQLTPGAKVRGKTIAELGNGNTPLDMIVYQKEGKNFLLMANDRRGVMKVGIDNLDRTVNITERVPNAEIKHDNLSFETVAAWTGIVHLDSLDNAYAVVLQRDNANSPVNLQTRALP